MRALARWIRSMSAGVMLIGVIEGVNPKKYALTLATALATTGVVS